MGESPRLHAGGRGAGVVPALPEDAHDDDAPRRLRAPPTPTCSRRSSGASGLYGLAAPRALITVIVASNAQTASAATARANTPIKVVSYQSLAPEQVEKAAYRSPFDSPAIDSSAVNTSLYDRSTFPSLADRRRHHGG